MTKLWPFEKNSPITQQTCLRWFTKWICDDMSYMSYMIHTLLIITNHNKKYQICIWFTKWMQRCTWWFTIYIHICKCIFLHMTQCVMMCHHEIITDVSSCFHHEIITWWFCDDLNALVITKSSLNHLSIIVCHHLLQYWWFCGDLYAFVIA